MTDQERRILLMYISKVSGHRSATRAVEKSVNKRIPNSSIKSINGFGYTYPVLEKVVNQAYMSVIKSTPQVWDYMYDNPKIVKRSVKIKNFLHKTSHKKLEPLFDEFRPDTVVCSQAFPCGMVADYKRAHNLDLTLIGVLTDYAPHSFWINEGVDYYVVPSKDTKERFIIKGVDPDKIKVFGIPIRYTFAQESDKKETAAKMDLNLDKPVVLIMGGGQGLGPIRKVVKALLKMPIDCQMIVITGTNQRLMKWLNRKSIKKSKKKIIAIEYANNVDELMDIATLIVTKPGGMTTAECLAKGLPIVIVDPLPGQEMRNTDFLLREGAAVLLDKNDVGEEIEILLQSPHRLEKMRECALKNAYPNAAENIAELIAKTAPKV